MKLTTAATLAIGTLIMAAGSVFAQPADSTVNFDVAGPGDWNVAANWLAPGFGPVIPGDGFPSEVVGISNGGIAELTSPALFPVQGVVLGETHDPFIMNPMEEDGTLNISGNGMLTVTGPAPEGASLRIGNNGRGVLNFSGGSVSTDSISVGGAADSALNLSGSATLAVSLDANLARTTRVEGPNVVLDVEGDLQIGGAFLPVITGAAHSSITVVGNATLGGTLRPSFGGGFSPAPGDSWTLIAAGAVTGVFDEVDTSMAPTIPRGATFDVRYGEGGGGDVVLSLDNRLILSVNAATGAAQISNAIGDDIELDGYTIVSPGDNLSTAGWSSLESQGVDAWQEALPGAGRLTELNPSGASLLDAGGLALDLGNPYLPPEFLAAPDLTFEYTTTAGDVVAGLVEIEGFNSLVLQVDPTTGEGQLLNPTLFDVDLSGYAIGSDSGSLLPGGFGGIGQGDWQLANPTVNHLTELNPSESTIVQSGNVFNLGTIFDTAGTMDLMLDFHLRGAGGEVLAGGVIYEPIDSMGQEGDTNGDGVVNIDDLNAVRNNFGTGDGTDLSGIPGDAFPFDGFVNLDDLNGVRNNFGAGAAAVPEPAGVASSVCGLLMLCFSHRRRTRR